MRRTIPIYVLSYFILLVYAPAYAQKTAAILITNVNIFDGQQEALRTGSSILIEGNTITQIADKIQTPAGATVIDAGGRTLMPGLIDMHYHIMLAGLPQQVGITADVGYVNHLAAQTARQVLMQGFTSIRDLGGNCFGLKRAIDEGLLAGPRIYPSGPMIGQTGGHSDFRAYTAVPSDPGAPLDYLQRNGMIIVADGVPEVLMRAREALRMGATQIKIMAGGGVASSYDPLDVSQYTFEEMKAAVDAAANWNTYVTVHAYTPKAIQQAIRAGVKCIDHGQLMDDPTARMMADSGTWLSLQPFLDDEDANPYPAGSPNREKQKRMMTGTEKAYQFAKKYNIKTAFGTDVLFAPKKVSINGKQLAKLTRWYAPFEVLKMATHDNAQLLQLCGPRNPYGVLGVVKEGALADLILVDGNPLENMDLIADPDKNFLLIMKDGKIFKNTVPN